MKKLLLSAMLLAMSATVFADHISSKFVLKIMNYGDYTVMFDNDVYATTEGVDVMNVSPGEHFIRITESVRSAYKANARGSRLVYEGYINVPRRSKVIAKVNANNFFNIQNIVPLQAYNQPRNGKYHNNSGCGVSHHGADCRTTHARVPRATVSFYGGFYNEFQRCGQDARRLAYARQHLRGNHLTSAQTRQLAMTFTNDRYRAEFLQIAYPHVSDRNNFRATVNCVKDPHYRKGVFVSLRI